MRGCSRAIASWRPAFCPSLLDSAAVVARPGLAWGLQLVALVIVGAALPIGLVYDALRVEVSLLAVGGGLFLLGRWLQGPAR